MYTHTHYIMYTVSLSLSLSLYLSLSLSLSDRPELLHALGLRLDALLTARRGLAGYPCSWAPRQLPATPNFPTKIIPTKIA